MVIMLKLNSCAALASLDGRSAPALLTDIAPPRPSMISLRHPGLLPEIELCLQQRQHLFPRQTAKTSDQ